MILRVLCGIKKSLILDNRIIIKSRKVIKASPQGGSSPAPGVTRFDGGLFTKPLRKGDCRGIRGLS
jgi:hypothetical protein